MKQRQREGDRGRIVGIFNSAPFYLRRGRRGGVGGDRAPPARQFEEKCVSSGRCADRHRWRGGQRAPRAKRTEEEEEEEMDPPRAALLSARGRRRRRRAKN